MPTIQRQAPNLVPILHAGAYVAPLPQGHRFPMNKYHYLIEQLRSTGLATAANEIEPRPAPRAWLDLAHDADYVSAVLEQRVPPDIERRIGFAVTREVALRSQLSCAGTLMAARLALETGIALNSAGGSHHAHADFGAGFCGVNDVAVAARVVLGVREVVSHLVVYLEVPEVDGTESEGVATGKRMVGRRYSCLLDGESGESEEEEARLVPSPAAPAAPALLAVPDPNLGLAESLKEPRLNR